MPEESARYKEGYRQGLRDAKQIGSQVSNPYLEDVDQAQGWEDGHNNWMNDWAKPGEES